jgi:hypothetical protein
VDSLSSKKNDGQLMSEFVFRSIFLRSEGRYSCSFFDGRGGD